MEESLLQELKRYVGFDATDEEALRALHPLAAPHFVRIADLFYRRILDHEVARKALEGGESQVGRLKVTLREWMNRLLSGPWDEDYFQARAKIGRVHVRIGLPQHYMFGAMNVLRSELNDLIHEHYSSDVERLRIARRALGKILDIELAIMLHTYREDLLSQQAKMERLSAYGQVVGFIGHELRNPLSVIETSLHILKGRIPPGDERIDRHIQRIGEQVFEANDIITNLLDLIRDRVSTRESIQLGALIGEAAARLEHPPEVVLVVSGMEGIPAISGNAAQLRRVFSNLLQNAIQATSPRGKIQVSAEVKNGMVEIAVADTGPGVAPEIKKRLFEVLVTTKDQGVGLGLALARRFVEQHGGSVSLDTAYSAGARFCVRLPILP